MQKTNRKANLDCSRKTSGKVAFRNCFKKIFSKFRFCSLRRRSSQLEFCAVKIRSFSKKPCESAWNASGWVRFQFQIAKNKNNVDIFQNRFKNKIASCKTKTHSNCGVRLLQSASAKFFLWKNLYGKMENFLRSGIELLFLPRRNFFLPNRSDAGGWRLSRFFIQFLCHGNSPRNRRFARPHSVRVFMSVRIVARNHPQNSFSKIQVAAISLLRKIHRTPFFRFDSADCKLANYRNRRSDILQIHLPSRNF